MKSDKQLGPFLKARREKMDPSVCGFSAGRRRTPGLRREEVAQRANISPKWYTFLEQGRGGPPSIEVLHRLSAALDLTSAEREHLFHLAQPRTRTTSVDMACNVPLSLQRLLDAMEFIPALVKTSAWDIVAWNRAAVLTLTDYGAMPPERRNLLRMLFADPAVKASMDDWESHARFAIAAFRLETARVGRDDDTLALVEELSTTSAAFAAMWSDHEVAPHGRGVKTIRHTVAGTLSFEYATFAVDGRADLGLVVFTPATPAATASVRALVES